MCARQRAFDSRTPLKNVSERAVRFWLQIALSLLIGSQRLSIGVHVDIQYAVYTSRNPCAECIRECARWLIARL